jgi:hypothetical protein
MGHPNEDILRKVDEAMIAGDMDGYWAGHTPDAVYHIGGSSPMAGAHKGADQLQAMFGKFMGAVGEFTFENHAYLADDEHGVILQRSKMTRGGETFTSNDAFIAHFRDGKIAEMWMFPEDQAAYDAWLAAGGLR